ncbi:MAG: cytochrome c [Burkholderiales bacterium]|nr:cytochrome c [Burkholderiales bacterium]
MKPVAPVVMILAVACTFSATAAAQTPAERAIKYRQAALSTMGFHFFGILAPMAKGERPYDAQVAARSAKFVAELSEMPWHDGFPAGSDAGAPTKAKPEIWKDKAKFDKLAQAMQAEAAKLGQVAGTDLATMRTQVQATAKACTNCHDEFRAR